MHSLETILERLDQINAVVQAQPDEAVDLMQWIDRDERCGTVCCALGWATEKHLYDLFFHRGFEPAVRDGSNTYIGYQAAEFVLFGTVTNGSITKQFQVTEALFNPRLVHHADVVDDITLRTMSDRELFNCRVQKAKIAITDMFR